jgi:hypothetical protein
MLLIPKKGRRICAAPWLTIRVLVPACAPDFLDTDRADERDALFRRGALERLYQGIADIAVVSEVPIDFRARHTAQPGNLGDGELRDRLVAAQQPHCDRDAGFVRQVVLGEVIAGDLRDRRRGSYFQDRS